MMPQLYTSSFLSQIFWLVITFIALYIYLSIFILPKLENIISNRAGATFGNLEKAILLQDKITKLQHEIIKENHITNDKVAEMHIKFAEKINLIKQQHLQEISANFLKKQELIKSQIIEDKKQSSAQMQDYVIEFTSAVVEKITGQKPDHKNLKKYYSGIEVKL